MENDKNTLIAFVLIFVVIIAFWWYNAPQKEQGIVPVNSGETTSQNVQDSTFKQPLPEKSTTSAFSNDKQDLQKTESARHSDLPFFDNGIDSSKTIIVESALYRGIITNRGATVRSWKLKKFGKPKSKKIEGQVLADDWVEMIGPNSNFQHYFGQDFGHDLDDYHFNNLNVTLPLNSGEIKTGEIVFKMQPEKGHLELSSQNLVDSVSFILKFSDTGYLRKTFLFYNDRYDFDLKIELVGINELLAHSYYKLAWESGLSPTESDVADDMNYAKGYVLTRKELVIEEAKDPADQEELKPITGRIDWLSTTTKYFGMSIIPQFTEKESYDLLHATVVGEKIQLGPNKDLVWQRIHLNLEVPAYSNQTISHQYKIYLGPLDYFILKKYDLELEKMIDLGMRWLRPISIGILYAFTKIRSFIPNYGWVIVIFSILVKILLHPLTKKSYSSMKKMQDLQPELNALKEKHKDPKKLQQAQLQMYKEKGVNPAGGCLPMLLQMPLLFALYWVFRNTIELRGEPFIWWITDLSMPDTIFNLGFSLPLYGDQFNILPILMGVSMLIQQKMTMKDPKQMAMVYIMPIFMILIFNKLSSGLNLYYTLFNVFSLIQQGFPKTDSIGKNELPASSATKETKPGATPGSSKKSGRTPKK
jgi:YidC/Oxa1 family membrane protein insertase